MNKFTSPIVGAFVGFVVLFGGLFLLKTPATTPTVAAVSSPDIISPYFSFGGVREWASHTEALTQATTTVCALQSPAATSTLQFGSIRFSVSSSTATTITLAKAATQYATTTLLNSASIAAGAQGTVIASTTESVNPDGISVFSPNTWFVVGMQGNTGSFSPTGSCSAIWIEN